MKEDFLPWFLDKQDYEDIPEVIEYYEGFKTSTSPINRVEVFGHISGRLMDTVQTLFTYTDAHVRNFHLFEKVKINKNVILLISAFEKGEHVLRFLAGEKNKGLNKIGQRVLWLDLHRNPRTEDERVWLETVIPFCDIVTTGSKRIQTVYGEIYKDEDVFFHTIETLPDVVFKEVGSVLELEKKSKSPRVLWCGNLHDLPNLEPFLKEATYPITASIRDGYNVVHPKLELLKTKRKRSLHYSDFLLITQEPEDPFYRQLIKEALIKGVVPLVLKKELDGNLNQYTLEVKPFNLNKLWLKDILYMNTSAVEEMLLEGQHFVLQEYTTLNNLEALIELYKACEILLERKKLTND